MNPQSVSLAGKLGSDLKKELSKVQEVEVVVAPPFVYLESVERSRGNTRTFSIGAQNVHSEKLGSHTGEVSLSMLQSFGVTHIILGHSERRAEGENDDAVNKKLFATIKGELTGVVCVGESKRDHGG